MKTFRMYEFGFLVPRIAKDASKLKITLHDKTLHINVNSIRLQCFKLNPMCVNCGIVGNIWALQSHMDENPHFNLYHRNESLKLTLMTKDHIIPKSKGGKY